MKPVTVNRGGQWSTYITSHLILTGEQGSCVQWCSLRDTQVYAVYPLGKSKDFRIPT